ncbi:Gfo/Idh/MocA family protein [Synoicihabitans lomoniglobus]|uniref:Gfo/Idh/MocA family oxidoreductase n=1 Tax=Synoicihabitans lomoniglobus TaxID=2909285 RepID=A0AAE9ZVW5_9BACT|nr:Gfo/Idh/MocA family oxidoreductase [Opitutaceae bacterium LMO-M01]WED64134.1 Gfo/Idh/MocA family oxidoreductase [Opitutaceae bacterium LMO-M01]
MALATPLETVRWGIIGVGDVCEVKSGPALQKIAGSELVAVMRRSGDQAADYAKRHGVPKWYDDADALIADPDINAIYIATPPGSHEDYTRRAAAVGKPVYVEKPMARSHAECARMVQVCADARVPLFVAFYRRRLPNILKIEQLLRDGAIGEIAHVEVKVNKPVKPDIVGAAHDPANWRLTPELSGGGYFYDLGSHQLDVLDYLLGPIAAASGLAANRGGAYDTSAEDTTVGHFRFASGVLGHGAWCFCASDQTDEELITIVGTAGEIQFDCFSGHHVELRTADGIQKRMTFDIPAHIQQPLLQTIVDELRGQADACPSTGVSGARTAWVMDQLCQRAD